MRLSHTLPIYSTLKVAYHRVAEWAGQPGADTYYTTLLSFVRCIGRSHALCASLVCMQHAQVGRRKYKKATHAGPS
jgi:hypothetical protein